MILLAIPGCFFSRKMKPHQNLEILYIELQFEKHIKMLRSNGLENISQGHLLNSCMKRVLFIKKSASHTTLEWCG
jgi:hypothetical protein